MKVIQEAQIYEREITGGGGGEGKERKEKGTKEGALMLCSTQL